MKKHFIKMFNYDRFANRAMLDAIEAAGAPQEALRLMAHLLASQQVWLRRCKDPNFRTGPLWPDGDIENLRTINEENHQAWTGYLEERRDQDFNTTLLYVNAVGDQFSNLLSDICAHVINHGTHHRAQAGQQIKGKGVEKLPVTDYVFFLRQ